MYGYKHLTLSLSWIKEELNFFFNGNEMLFIFTLLETNSWENTFILYLE